MSLAKIGIVFMENIAWTRCDKSDRRKKRTNRKSKCP